MIKNYFQQTPIYDTVMSFVYDQLLDDQWSLIAANYRLIGKEVAFHIAFIAMWAHTEDEVTLQSKSRRKGFWN